MSQRFDDAELSSLSCGARVRVLRRAHGLRLADLAERVGSSVALLNRIELDRRPLGEYAEPLAAALGVSVPVLTAPPVETLPGEVQETLSDPLLVRIGREPGSAVVNGRTVVADVPLYFAVRKFDEANYPESGSLIYARVQAGFVVARREEVAVWSKDERRMSSEISLELFAVVSTTGEHEVGDEMPELPPRFFFADDGGYEPFGLVVYISADRDDPDGYAFK